MGPFSLMPSFPRTYLRRATLTGLSRSNFDVLSQLRGALLPGRG